MTAVACDELGTGALNHIYLIRKKYKLLQMKKITTSKEVPN